MIKLFGPFQKNCNKPGIFELETVRLTKRRCTLLCSLFRDCQDRQQTDKRREMYDA